MHRINKRSISEWQIYESRGNALAHSEASHKPRERAQPVAGRGGMGFVTVGVVSELSPHRGVRRIHRISIL